MATVLELAAQLKAQLDAVATNAQARAVAAGWLKASADVSAGLTGFQGQMVDVNVVSPDVELLTQLRDGFPDDGQAVDVPLWEGPAGLKRAIGRVAAGVWSVKQEWPAGIGFGDDLASVDLAAGASQVGGWVTDVVKEVGSVAGDVTGGLLKGLWPVLLVAAVVIAGAVVVSARVKA